MRNTPASPCGRLMRFMSASSCKGQSVPMLPQAAGWFVADVRCGAGTRYHFNIDGERDVPDPASRLQHADVHGDSVVVDPLAYPGATAPGRTDPGMKR